MAKAKANKAQAVRDYLTANPDAGVKEVVSALKEKGIKIQDSRVYFIRGKMRAKKRRQTREKVAKVSPNSDPLTLIREIKALAQRSGGLGKLQELVEALAE